MSDVEQDQYTPAEQEMIRAQLREARHLAREFVERSGAQLHPRIAEIRARQDADKG